MNGGEYEEEKLHGFFGLLQIPLVGHVAPKRMPRISSPVFFSNMGFTTEEASIVIFFN